MLIFFPLIFDQKVDLRLTTRTEHTPSLQDLLNLSLREEGRPINGKKTNKLESWLDKSCQIQSVVPGIKSVKLPIWATLDVRHSPASSCNAPLSLTKLSSKPVRVQANTRCLPRKAFSAVLSSPSDAKMWSSLDKPAATAAYLFTQQSLTSPPSSSSSSLSSVFFCFVFEGSLQQFLPPSVTP